MIYKITVKPDKFSGYAPEDWLIALKSVDRDADVADFRFDNGNTVWEVNSSEDLSSLSRVRGVVSVEQVKPTTTLSTIPGSGYINWTAA